MYVHVVVLTYQAPGIESFAYKVPKELESEIKLGQLVEVPFGKRQPMGIVMSCFPEQHEGSQSKDSSLIYKNDKKVVIKPISKIIWPRPLLLPFQIELVKWMSCYYLAPMVNCLEVILPKIPKRLEQYLTNLQKSDILGQSLILVPTINKIAETTAKFPKAKSPVIYHNELKTSEKFAIWIKILSGQADYIFGSRSAIFTPCQNLKEIIIYDEHDGAYKDDRSPYFDTLTVAQKISQLTRIQIKIVDPSPKISTYFQIPNRIKIQKFGQETKIINMTQDKMGGNRSPVSYDLEQEIARTLENQGKVFLFINKKKEAGNVFCKNCKNYQYLPAQPQKCPKCNSTDIIWNILNVNSLEREIKKLFPKALTNLILDDNRLTTINSSAQLNIGTAYAFYAQLAQKYDLVASVQTDSLINLADYTAAEKLFAQITNLKKLLKPNGKLFIQTYNPQHPVLENAANSNYLQFFKMEIGQRKALNYAPFSLMIKITFKGKSTGKVKTQANLFSQKLHLSQAQNQMSILGPYESIFWQREPSYHIILRYQTKSFTLSERQSVVEKISPLLQKGSKSYQIEVEPEGIQ